MLFIAILVLKKIKLKHYILSTLISAVVVVRGFQIKAMGSEYFGPIVDQYYEDGTLPDEFKIIDQLYSDEQKDELIEYIDKHLNK
jgi:hypothetical protein